MFSKLRGHMRHNVVAYLALFVALGGTSAWATHETILSSDIVDGEVKTVDLGAAAVTSPKIATNAVTNAKIGTAAVTNAKLASNAVATGKVLDNNLTGADILNGSLTSADMAVGSGSFSFDYPSIPANTCDFSGSGLVSGVLGGDNVIVNAPTSWPPGLLVQPYASASGGGIIYLDACNITTSAIDPPIQTFDYAVIR